MCKKCKCEIDIAQRNIIPINNFSSQQVEKKLFVELLGHNLTVSVGCCLWKLFFEYLVSEVALVLGSVPHSNIPHVCVVWMFWFASTKTKYRPKKKRLLKEHTVGRTGKILSIWMPRILIYGWVPSTWVTCHYLPKDPGANNKMLESHQSKLGVHTKELIMLLKQTILNPNIKIIAELRDRWTRPKYSFSSIQQSRSYLSSMPITR